LVENVAHVMGTHRTFVFEGVSRTGGKVLGVWFGGRGEKGPVMLPLHELISCSNRKYARMFLLMISFISRSGVLSCPFLSILQLSTVRPIVVSFNFTKSFTNSKTLRSILRIMKFNIKRNDVIVLVLIASNAVHAWVQEPDSDAADKPAFQVQDITQDVSLDESKHPLPLNVLSISSVYPMSG
jgi:hypothetical protein